MSEVNERQILRYSQIAVGKDPDASQAVTDFMDMKNIVERSSLPTTDTVLCLASLDVAGQVAYQSRPDNIFFKFRDSLARAYMARQGENKKLFVDMVKQTPSMADLQTIGESQQRGVFDRLLGRRKQNEMP
jgi:hypothetical protein